MKEKILKLADGTECYVVEEIVENRRKFCLAYEVDTTREVLYNRFMILEEKIENGQVVVSGVSDEERMNITALILDKIKTSVEDSNI